MAPERFPRDGFHVVHGAVGLDDESADVERHVVSDGAFVAEPGRCMTGTKYMPWSFQRTL